MTIFGWAAGGFAGSLGGAGAAVGLADGQWHHVAMVWASGGSGEDEGGVWEGQQLLYVDGTLRASAPYAPGIAAAASSLWLGGGSDGAGRRWPLADGGEASAGAGVELRGAKLWRQPLSAGVLAGFRTLALDRSSCTLLSRDGHARFSGFGFDERQLARHALSFVLRDMAYSTSADPTPGADQEKEPPSWRGTIGKPSFGGDGFRAYEDRFPVRGAVVAASCTHLTVSFSSLAPEHQGLYCTVSHRTVPCTPLAASVPTRPE